MTASYPSNQTLCQWSAFSNNMVDLARFEFKRTLEELRAAKGAVSSLSSFYIPPGILMHEAVGRVRQELQWAGMISTPSTRKVVESNLEVMVQVLKGYRKTPDNGLCIFVGVVPAASGRTSQHRWVIEPPLPVPYLKYYVENHFLLEPLESMLDEGETYGLLVMDLGEATLGRFQGGRIEMLWTDESLVPNKHGQGGQSSQRFARLRQEAIHVWSQKIEEKLKEIFTEPPNTFLVGGPGLSKDAWVEKYWPFPNSSAKTFDVGYTNERGLSDLVHSASDYLRAKGEMVEKDTVNLFLSALAKDTGLGTYGKEIVAQAIEYGAVETLLISESLPAEEMRSLAGLAEQTGANVKVISGQTEEGKTLERSFGGVAALLRYRL